MWGGRCWLATCKYRYDVNAAILNMWASWLSSIPAGEEVGTPVSLPDRSQPGIIMIAST